jgi:hypothetical protein
VKIWSDLVKRKKGGLPALVPVSDSGATHARIKKNISQGLGWTGTRTRRRTLSHAHEHFAPNSPAFLSELHNLTSHLQYKIVSEAHHHNWPRTEEVRSEQHFTCFRTNATSKSVALSSVTHTTCSHPSADRNGGATHGGGTAGAARGANRSGRPVRIFPKISSFLPRSC